MLAVRCIGIILTMVSCQVEEIKQLPNSINSFHDITGSANYRFENKSLYAIVSVFGLSIN
jgi:hypothetical protein